MRVAHERIKSARMKKGISQTKMAAQLGISQPGYNQMESGKYEDMKVSTLIKICNILDADPNWILGMGEDNTP